MKRKYTNTKNNFYKNIYNNLNNKIKREMANNKAISWNSLCSFTEKDKPNEAIFWKKINNLQNQNNKHTNILPSSHLNDEEKANLFANNLESILINHNNPNPKYETNDMSNNLDTITDEELNMAMQRS